VAYYNDPMTSAYDHLYIGDNAYNNLKNYTIELNAAPGGSVPSSGWVTSVTVTNNHYHSRTHLVDMTGYNWIRINVTASDGSSGNNDAAINFDVHDASQGANDSWFFLGDSITQDGMHHYEHDSNGASVGNNFSEGIAAARPGYFPAFEDAGIGGLWSTDGAQNINTWLALTPAKYIGLSYGSNDANACSSPTDFYNHYVTMVNAVLAAGRIPVIPTIPGSKTANITNCGPGFNAQIQNIYNAYPQVIHGPDLWTFFRNNPGLISGDNLHPNAAGYAAMRQQWVNAVLSLYP
jgi:lysophospholipase L1-like esterase